MSTRLLILQYKVAHLLFAFLVAIVAFGPAINGAESGPRIDWSNRSIEVTIGIGGTATESVSFTPTMDLDDVKFEAVPEIAGFVTISPHHLASLSANHAQNLSLTFTAPTGTVPGTYQGTVHLRHGARTVPTPLKVTLHVVETKFTLFSNPADPLLLRVRNADGGFVEYYGTKDESGLARSLSLVVITSAAGETTRVYLDAQARPVHIIAPNGSVFDISWLSATNILFTAISPDGSIQANLVVDLTQITSSALVSNPALQSFGSDESAFSGISTVFGEQFQMRGGRLSEALVTTRELPMFAAPLAAEATGPSTINVSKCGAPVTNANVLLSVIPPNGDAYTIPANHIGSGQYVANIPTSPSPGQPVENLCKSVANVLDVGCNMISTIPDGLEVPLCEQLAVVVATLGMPAVGAALLEACPIALLAGKTYCNTVGYSGPVPGGDPQFAESLCKKISDVIDSYTVDTLYMFPMVFIPGSGMVEDESSAHAPGTGPFPTFTVDAGGSMTIESFTTAPGDPGPGQGYLAEALVSCIPPGTAVTISISGTDGYNDSVTTVLPGGDANVALFVPGGAEGVVDTITVQINGGPSRTIVLVF